MTLRSASGVLATALVLAGAAPAFAASGITPLSPKSNSTVPAGQSPTFKMRVKGKGQVWVHVCKSNKKNSDGVICSEESRRPELKPRPSCPELFEPQAHTVRSPRIARL